MKARRSPLRSTAPTLRPAARRVALAVDVVPVTPTDDELAVLLVRSTDPKARERWTLPWDAPRDTETLEQAALRIARSALGSDRARLDQIGAFGDARRHPGDADLSVGYAALVPLGAAWEATAEDAAWYPLSKLPGLTPRHRAIIDRARDSLCARVDLAPIAFHLLPAAFTLTELQATYELLLGRRLHKASFRRTLQAAALVQPLDEWRSEGRGRPAQLFRYAPRKRRGARRGVRFDIP